MRVARYLVAGVFTLMAVGPVAAAPGEGGGEFPGNGNGNNGTFPGGGATNGVFPGKGNGVTGNTVSTNEPLSLVLTGLGLVGASLVFRKRR